MSTNLFDAREAGAPLPSPRAAVALEREVAAPGLVPGLPRSTRPGRLPLPEAVNTRRIVWPYLLTVVGYHLIALLAFVPWLFSWTGVVLVVLGAYTFGTLGITVCYHRLLTHRGFVCAKWLEHTLAILGVCCTEDSPAHWVAVHRRHHQHADEQPDPHSPLVNFFWGHVGWMLVRNEDLSRLNIFERYAKDVVRDPFYKFVERFYAWIIVASWAVFFFGGISAALLLGSSTIETVQFGLSVLIWGVFVRTVVVWHMTWSVNSVAHRWGYRNYETDEDSRNNAIVAILASGEGWHNNHHADPRSAKHGHRWWEFDLAYLWIALFAKLGLVSNVVMPNPHIAAAHGRLATHENKVVPDD